MHEGYHLSLRVLQAVSVRSCKVVCVTAKENQSKSHDLRGRSFSTVKNSKDFSLRLKCLFSERARLLQQLHQHMTPVRKVVDWLWCNLLQQSASWPHTRRRNGSCFHLRDECWWEREENNKMQSTLSQFHVKLSNYDPKHEEKSVWQWKLLSYPSEITGHQRTVWEKQLN